MNKIRHMAIKDIPAVALLAQLPQHVVLALLTTKDIVCLVHTDNVPIGFVIYELREQKIVLLHIVNAIHILSDLKMKNFDMLYYASETKLDTQLELKVAGFVAMKSLRDYFSDTGEDAILFYWGADKT